MGKNFGNNFLKPTVQCTFCIYYHVNHYVVFTVFIVELFYYWKLSGHGDGLSVYFSFPL